jgi:hypothetical protein
MMWDAKKRTQFEHLRAKEDKGTLTRAERAMLTAMVEEIEGAESARLAPAIQRLDDECAQVEAQNAALKGLIQRKKDLVRRLEQILVETNAEEDAIRKELGRILTGGASTSS